MPALARVPCPHCGSPNLPYDPACLACGRPLLRPTPAPTTQTFQPRFEPDQQCPRCQRVLVNARDVTAEQSMGGLDSGGGAFTTHRIELMVRACAGLVALLTGLFVGGVQRKSRGRGLQNALRDDPNALYCSNCGLVVKSYAR